MIKLNNKKGFTIIEMIVAVSIFIIIMVIATGALLSIVEANRKAQALQSIINNLNFSLEEMVRKIRVGTDYHCGKSSNITKPNDCLNGDYYFAFEPSGGDAFTGPDIDNQVVYRLENNRVERSTTGTKPKGFTALTAPQAVIENLTFYVTGSKKLDDVQPRVLIIISGYVEINKKTRTEFNLQTAISQRLLDN